MTRRMTGRMDGKDDHHHRNRTKPRILYIKIKQLYLILFSADNEVQSEHLKNMKGDKEWLELVKADVLDYAAMLAAVDGMKVCSIGVFHTACPVTGNITDPEVTFQDSQIQLPCEIPKPRPITLRTIWL